MPDSYQLKRKKKSKTSVEETLKSYDYNYDFTHMQFNFSFITSSNGRNIESLTKVEKALLSERLYDMSNEPFEQIMLRGKERGFETIDKKDLKLNCHCAQEFYLDDYRSRNCPDKYWIFRLHPNNQGSDCRILGKIIDKVFYIMFFYVGHECYK